MFSVGLGRIVKRRESTLGQHFGVPEAVIHEVCFPQFARHVTFVKTLPFSFDCWLTFRNFRLLLSA